MINPNGYSVDSVHVTLNQWTITNYRGTLVLELKEAKRVAHDTEVN